MSADARTVSFLALLNGTAHRCGLDPAQLGAVEAAALAEYLSDGVQEVWTSYDWPAATRIERRAFRPEFSLAEMYSYGAEVFVEDPPPFTEADGAIRHFHYWRAVHDAFAGRLVTDAAYWEPARHILKSLDFAPPGQCPIAELLSAWNGDPRRKGLAPSPPSPPWGWSMQPQHDETLPAPLSYILTEGGAQFDDLTPDTIWINFRVPPPRFSTQTWSASATYAAGRVVYLPPAAAGAPGDCYLALDTWMGAHQGPVQNPEGWLLQRLPEIMAPAVRTFARAHWLESEGQDQRAGAADGLANDRLDRATETLSVQQGQTHRYAVANRATAGGLYRPRRVLH